MRIRRYIRIIMLLTAAALMLITMTSCGVQDSPKPPSPESRGDETPPQETQNSSQGTPVSQETQTEQAETPKVSPAEQEKEPSPGTDEEPETTQETSGASAETPVETAEASETPEETETADVSAKPENPSQGQDGAPADKVAYITIDDGPSRKITPAILDLLMAENIKATFFVLPHSGLDDIYQRIIDEGHELGNHSYSHVYANLYKSDNIEAFKEDVMAARNFIYDNFGYLTVAYRFPGGAMGRKDSIIQPRKEYLAEIGYRWFDWNLSTGDADATGSGKNAEILAANVLNNVKGRSHAIILMHDTYDKSATLEALPIIIAGMRERGYVFETISNYPAE